MNFLNFSGVSVRWLATGEGEQLMDIPFLLPAPDQLGLREDALFSTAYDTYIGPNWALSAQSLRNHSYRWSLANHIAAHAKCHWLITIPDTALTEFVASLVTAGGRLLDKYPAPSQQELLQRRSALAELEALYQNNKLTRVTLSGNMSSMHSEIPNLVERLKKATSPRGKKAELARFMDVEPPRVSEWLSGNREPCGETTLRLLRWVEQQDAQQKQGASSVSPPPAPKTQSQETNEKKPKSGRNKE
ncbi:MAG: hypothetical protein NT154_01405 [Verrucomicrobia bacterium]|nr:hypothetical protein [Verrucomicrobiota bacterium]